MLILNDPSLVDRIPDPDIRELVHRRFSEICGDELYDYDTHGYMIVVEPGDSVEVLEREISFPILRNLFDGTRYGGAGFPAILQSDRGAPWLLRDGFHLQR